MVVGLLTGTSALASRVAADSGSGSLDALIEYRPGTLPLILTIPHGGTRTPALIPDRISATLERYDVNSLELGREISDAIERQSGERPYMVIDHVHRKKVDVNREALEGAQDDPLAVRNWERYHLHVARACSAVSEQFGTGLLVDLHGHRHRKRWVEIGYLLTGRQLREADDSLSGMAAASSIHHLVLRSGLTLAELVRGSSSLGTLLAQEGYDVVPSTIRPDPGGDPYFSGGYTIEHHGSSSGGVISAVQVETPLETVRDTERDRKAFARAFAAAILKFLERYYDR